MEKILEEIINNTCKLMEFITIKENYKEFEKAFSYIKKQLNNYYIIEKEVNHYKNLIISNSKEKNLDIIFCCHIDVVPSTEYKGIIEGNILKGRGAFDMKGQLSTIISLLKNNTTSKKIALIITSDEEIGGKCCQEIMKEYNSSIAVIPDAGKDFSLVVEEKGLLQIELKVKGISSHASSPFEGENAIIKAMKIYQELLKKYPMPKDKKDFKTSINLSKLHGGDTMNKVCDEAILSLDIRFSKETTIEKLLKDIEEIGGYEELKILDQGPMFFVDDNNPIIEEFKNNAKKILGHNLIIEKCLATSDAIYFSEKNIPVIMINPIGDYWHHPKEYVEIDSLYTLYLLFKTLL